MTFSKKRCHIIVGGSEIKRLNIQTWSLFAGRTGLCGALCGRLLLFLLGPHQIRIPLFAGLQGHALVGIGVAGSLLLGLLLLLLGRLLAGQISLITTGHDQVEFKRLKRRDNQAVEVVCEVVDQSRIWTRGHYFFKQEVVGKAGFFRCL